ncbi:MAG TPA: LAGLIDADG family homing endonuclease, partial [Nitrososphaerales archaeon]|nr:LAGLIDADG family homing endonuclease [Nitrososphaerales archaeon]
MGSLASVRFRVNEIPEGTLLYDRRSGLTVLLDDFHGKRCWSKPLNVAVQITNRCNRSCKWCYASSSPSEARGLWTREKILELCKYLDEWGVCLHPDETIIIRRNDTVSQIKVREAKPGDEIISYDIHSRTPTWGKIESVTLRSSKERLKKLVFFPGNRTVVVTADHLIPTLQHGLIKAASLAVGDECFSINRLPERRFTNAPLDLLDFALKLAREDRGINRYYLMNHGSKERIPRRISKDGNALSITKLADYKEIIDSIDRTKAGIRRGYSGYILPVRIPLSKSLARLIGYYLSEGDTRGFTLNKNEESRIHEIIQDYKSVFGYKLRTIQTENRQAIQLSANIWFNDFVFARVLGCGKGAPEKRIPDIAFNLQNDLVVELLRGLMGDGNLRHARDRLSLNYKTTSLQLSKGIRLLLLCLGIPSSVTSSVGKPRTIENRQIRLYQRKSYAVTVYGRHNIRKLLRVVQLDPRTVKLDLRARISKYSNTKFLSDKKCVLKSVEDADAPDFVVDLHVSPTNLFVAGDGLVVHNCGVAFGGGEPFTFPSFALLCREVWENTGLDVGATTNGDLVTDDDLTLLRGHFGQLRVS